MRSNLDEERSWWITRDLSSLTVAERNAVVTRFCLAEQPSRYRTLQEVGDLIGYTYSYVHVLIERARVKVNREALIASGAAMQLVRDEALSVTLIKQVPSTNPAQNVLDKLSECSITTYNQLLDKSGYWLMVAMGMAASRRIEQALRNENLFVRGEVPLNPRLRTCQPHVITR